MAKKPKVGQIQSTTPRFEYVDSGSMQFEGERFYDQAKAPAAEPAQKTGMLRTMGDQALALGQGAVGGVKMLSDLAGPDNAVSQALGGANTTMQGMYSPARAEEMRNRQAMIQAADDGTSTMDQITSRLGGIAEAPMQTLLQAGASMAPNIAAALATGGVSAGPGLVAFAARFGIPAALGVGMGVGSVKGQNYEAVFNKAKQGGATDEAAIDLAIKASEYSAQNAPQQALGGALGALDSLTGAERIIGSMTRKAGTEVAPKVAQGLLKRTALGGLEEAPAEGAQGAQGQYAQNEAMNNSGFSTDPWAGVAGAGVNDAVVGAMVGGPMGAMHNPAVAPNVALPQQAAADQIRATELVPESGAMTRAANAGTEAKARAVESMPSNFSAAPMATSMDGSGYAGTQSNGTGFSLDAMPNSAAFPASILDQAELDSLVQTEQRDQQVMLAQMDQERQKQAEIDAAFAAKPELDATTEAMNQAATVDAPNAMQAAFNKLNEQAAPQEQVAPAAPAKEPRIVARTPNMKPMPQELAELQVSMAGGEVARVQNANGKFGYVVVPKTPAKVTASNMKTAPGTQAGDVMNKQGNPFTNLFSAKTEASKRGPGFEPVKLREGAFVVRPVAPSGNSSSQEQIAATPAPVTQPTQPVMSEGARGFQPMQAAPPIKSTQGNTNVTQADQAVQGQAQQQAPERAPEQQVSDHIGQGNKPMAKGGKPFKTKDAATEAKKLQPMLRVVKSGKGFALAPKTEKQIAAQEAAARRLSIARTGTAGVPTAAHEFIAGEGGMDASTKAEFSFGNNPRVGNRTLFAGARGGMSLEVATEKLIEAGYLPEGATHSDTVALVNRSFTVPQHTADGTEVLAEAAINQHFDDYLTAQEEAAQDDAFDPFDSVSDMGFALDDAEWAGYDALEDPIKLEVDALLAQADALGIDTDTIKEGAHEDTRNGSDQDYYDATRDALTSAIEASNRSGNQDAGAPGNAGSEQGLTAPTRADVLAQQERADSATKAESAQRKAQDLIDKRERERKDIAKASEAAADTFVLGGDAEQNLSGQGNMFDDPAPAAQPTPKPKTPSAAELRAQADLQAALADLGDIFGRGTRLNMMPEQEAKILPVMVKLFDAAFRLGYIKFKDAAKFALDKIRAALGSEVADDLTLEHLQGAYISMSSGKTGVDGIRTVSNIEAKSEIEQHTAQTDNERNGEPNVSSTDGRVERNSQEPGAQPAVGNPVSTGLRGTDPATAQAGGRTTGSTGGGRLDGIGLSSGGATAAGERSDQRLPDAGGPAGVASITAGADFREPGGDSGITGVPPEPIAANQVGATADQSATGLKAGIERARADKAPVKLADIDSIRATLPQLLPGQQDDVLVAEKRLAKDDGYGVLFTNGTGTGKTFSGLGIIKRYALQGKTNTLILAPDTKIASDWIKSGKLLGLDITELADTKDAGKGIVITTYANFGANDQVAFRKWDLVVADEAHTLMQDKDGTPTTYLHNLRAITVHPDGAYQRYAMLNRDDIIKAMELRAQITANNAIINNLDTMDVMVRTLAAENTKLTALSVKLDAELRAKQDAMKAEVMANQGAARPRLAALSATPFAYEKTIDWANGYLFDYNEGRSDESKEFRGYNAGSNQEQYFMQHFGYRMRTGKLTSPEGKVDSGLLQRAWNGNLKKSGALSGRMLDVAPDYDRRFVTVDSAIGNRIDEAIEWLSEQRLTAAKDDQGFSNLAQAINDQFKYQAKRYLLEAIKADAVIPIVKQHLAMGRKVVVFHDYKKGGGFNPFRVTGGDSQLKAAVEAFNDKFSDLVNHPFEDMDSPIEVFKRELPQTMLINGDEKKPDLLKRYESFQDDDTGPQVMLVQSAKNKGWSGHDTTGKHQRVLINLGQPTAPTLAIQQEGRIYRTGQASDAIMRYLNTGTNWERWTFASTIAGRASTAENLGMGEMARALKDSFIQSFEESDAYPPGHEGEGKGGKERDKAANDAITEYDRAKTHYWATQKKNSSTKAQEGVDYFATPEPLGLKMVQWLDARPGEDDLEPSAGHGAIARWLPDVTQRTVIEPSLALRSRLALVMDANEDRILNGTFEDHHVSNKYDGIVMNPPFGAAGRTAVDHLSKAATHLRDGGRIVALIPTGPAADKKFDKWFYESETRAAKPLGQTQRVGDYYAGDTVTIDGRPGEYTIENPGGAGVMLRPKAGGIPEGWRSHYFSSLKAGSRTEAYSPSSGLQLIANIKLPQVTFERAGTAVATRVVVIEKSDNNVMQRDRDLSDITDINELFDRLENMDFAQRSKPVAAEPVEELPAEKPVKAAKPAKVVVHAGDEVTIGGKKYEIEIYTTNAGKEKRGVWMESKAEAQKYSARAFTHNSNKGKWFVDEYWFPKDSEITKPESAPPKFSHSGGSIAIPASKWLPDTVIADEVEKRTSHFLHQAPIKIMDTANGFLPGAASDSDIAGAVHGGVIYLFRDQLATRADVQRTLFHEILHYGLRRFLTKDQFIGQMQDIYQRDASIKREADRWVATEEGKAAKEFGGDDYALARGVDEALAILSEPNQGASLMRTPIAIFTRKVTTWLANIAERLGFSDAAAYLRGLKNVEAREFIKSVFQKLNEDAMPASDRWDFTADPAFKKTKIIGQTSRQHTPEQLRAMANVGFRVEVPTMKERAQALWKDAGKKMAQGIVDQFAPVKALDGTAYGLLRLSKGASGAFESFLHGGRLKLTDGVYDFDDANKGGVIDKLLMPLQGEHHDFMRWVAANRAERLTAEGKEHLFSAQDIADLKTLASGQAAFDYKIQNGPRAGVVTRERSVIYSDSLATFNQFNKNILDMAEQSGLIDGASRQLWEHEFYVPFYRVADEDSGGVRGMNIKGSTLRQQAFKQLKGGKNALNADLLDNTLMNWAHLLDASAKNRAAKATIEAAERLGIAAGGNQTTLAQMGASINNKNGVVWFMDGGQKRYSLIDNQGDGPFLMTALGALEYSGMRNPVMDAMGTMKRVLTIGVTASPFFKIRNLIRDSVQVIGTSGINPNIASNVAKGWKLTDPKSDAYFRLLAGGGTIHFGTMTEGNEAKRVQALVESGVDAGTILGDDHKVKAFYRKFIEPGITAYNELGNRGEAINRAALYDQLVKGGMNHADASLQARDLMDFSMQGSFTTIRFLTQVVPFFNARIQGLYKLGRAAKEDPARFSAVIGATAMFSIALLAAYGDDDDWKKREEWDRNNFWWFKFGGTAFRIPKPFEIGAIATLAERGFELAFDKEMTGTRFRNQVVTLLGDNLSMNPVPQLVKPILDVYANKSSFSGRPIETMGMDRLQPEYRFTDRTSMAARGLSTAANTVTKLVGAEAPSPVQIDSMLRGYFGWLGSFVIGAGDVLARPATEQREHPSSDMWKTATGSMVSDLRDAPSRYVSAMYDQAKEIEQAMGTWRALQKEGKMAEAAEFFQDNKDTLTKYRHVESVKKQESTLNQRIRLIERSDLDADTKRARIRVIQETKDRVARSLS